MCCATALAMIGSTHEMRIAERVHVAGRAGHVRRHVHQANALRSLDASRFADFDLRIARVLQERRQPADLQLGAAVDQHIGVAQLNDEARTRIDEVRILGRFRQDADVDFVAADFAGERAEIRQGGDDVEFRLRASGKAQQRWMESSVLLSRFVFIISVRICGRRERRG